MGNVDELSPRELSVLKEIWQTGRTTDRTIVLESLKDDMIVEFKDGHLNLTAKGRRMLVRGSPSLWDIGS